MLVALLRAISFIPIGILFILSLYAHSTVLYTHTPISSYILYSPDLLYYFLYTFPSMCACAMHAGTHIISSHHFNDAWTTVSPWHMFDDITCVLLFCVVLTGALKQRADWKQHRKTCLPIGKRARGHCMSPGGEVH